MNSLQIAELVNARHDSVKRTIARLADQEAIEFPPMVEIPTATKPSQVYVFSGEQGKLDSITVVAQLCPAFTARIVIWKKDFKYWNKYGILKIKRCRSLKSTAVIRNRNPMRFFYA